MPRPARRLLVATLLAVAGTSALLGGTAPAAAAERDVPVAVGPDEGAFVEPGTVVLEWTAVDAPAGYEVVWTTEGGESSGTAATTATSAAIEVESGSFSWQVRALPDGEWSTAATFYADLELPTLAESEQQPVAAPTASPQGLDAIPGSVWIGGALGFSAVFLVVVVLQSRVRREQDA